MLHIKFKYRDSMSHWLWREQECDMTSVNACIEIYGLNEPDVDYEIVSVEEVEEDDN